MSDHDDQARIVLVSAGSEEQAETLAHDLVEQRLAACVSVVGGVCSTYRWQGQVTRDQEFLLVIKSRAERFEALRDRILELHSYETPEILALPVVDGESRYLEWLRESVEPAD